MPWRAASVVSTSWATTCSSDSAVVGAASAAIWRSSVVVLVGMAGGLGLDKGGGGLRSGLKDATERRD